MAAPGECWLWLGACYRSGYGVIRYEGRNWGVHRVVWSMCNGKIPDGKHILHRCDVRNCVNPTHLFVGTNYDNVQDMVSKGRNQVGEDRWNAELDEEDVLDIRHRFNAGTTQMELAHEYGVTRSTIQSVTQGRTWKHVGGPTSVQPVGARRV